MAFAPPPLPPPPLPHLRHRASAVASHLALLRGVLRHRLLGTLLVGAVLGLCVAVVEVLYRLSPDPSGSSDPLTYVERARDFPSRYADSDVPRSLRLGLLVPLRLAQLAFGYSQSAYLAVPIVAGAALAVGTFVLGVLLVNRTVGVAAAAVVVAGSPVFATLTVPSPDLLATALLCWGVVLAVALHQGRAVVATPWRRRTTLFAVGLLLGWGLVTQEVSVYAWPLVAVLLLWRLPRRSILWAVAPLALVIGADVLLNAALLGDPLARFGGLTQGPGLAEPLLVLVAAVAVGGVVGTWLVAGRYVSRHGTGTTLVRAGTALVAGAITIALAVPPVVLAHQARQSDPTDAAVGYAASGGTQLEQFRTWLADHAGGVGVLWADRSSARVVRIFANGVFGRPVWHGELEVWEPGRDQPRPAPGDYVLFYSPRSDRCIECRSASRALLGSAKAVPARWQPAFATSDGIVEIYLVR